MSVTLPCLHCGKPVTFPGFSTVDPSVVAGVVNSFCGDDCYRRHNMRLAQPPPGAVGPGQEVS